MKALSLYQPWASLVVTGAKQFETRSWSTKYRGPLLIHASKKFSSANRNLTFEAPFNASLKFKSWAILPTGAIIGRVDLVDCLTSEKWMIQNSWPGKPAPDGDGVELYLKDSSAQEYAFGDFSHDRYAWRLENPVRFDKPIPAKGSLGLWEVKEITVMELLS